MRCRIILVGSRLYQLTALSTRRHIRDPKVAKVFDSFTLEEQPAPPPLAETEPETDTAAAE